MKLTKYLAAAAAATIAFASSSAFAEPKMETPDYYFLGVNENFIEFMATDVEADAAAGTASAWVILIEPKESEGPKGPEKGAWVLEKFDCKAGTAASQKLVIVNASGTPIEAIAGSGDAKAPDAGTGLDQGLAVACKLTRPTMPPKVDVQTAGAYITNYERIVAQEHADSPPPKAPPAQTPPKK